MPPATRLLMALALLPAVLAPQVALAQSLFDTLVGVGTGIIANEIQQQSGQPARPQPTQQSRPSAQADPQTFAVQQRLQALGYDVGTPDGMMGPRTQRAIAAYQQSLGAAPTGTLNPAQYDALVGGSAPSAPAVAAAPPPSMGSSQAFQLLQNTDLPYNDYRSGMGDPSLRGGNVDACLAACAADAQCRAFTFNARAKVCFLKSAAGTPTPFNGATSGFRGTMPGVPTQAATPGGRPLTPSEIARLQAGLNARGYDVGKPDGVAGSRTRAAIARFVGENPGTATTDLDAALLAAVLQQPGQATTLAAVPFAPAQYRTVDELKRELALIALQHEPSLLDETGQLQSWFSTFVLNSDNPPSTMQQTYRTANAVEREAMLQRFRRDILAEAETFVAELPDGELRVRVADYTRFGGYLPGRGVELANRIDSKLLEVGSYVANRSFVGVVLDMPQIDAVPMASEAEASAFLDRVKDVSMNGNAQVVAWYTISNFGEDRNIVGAATARGTQIPMTVRLDRVTLVTSRPSGTSAPPAEVELAVLYDPSRAVARPGGGGASDNITIAQRLGLPVIDGHLAFAGGNSGNIGAAIGVGNDYNRTLWRYLTLAAIRNKGEGAGDWIDQRDVSEVMDETQHLLVYGQPNGYFYNFQNEFERRRALNVFTEQVLPQLVASAPSFPLDAVSILPVPLADYDFTAGAFPIETQERSLFWLPQTLANFRTGASYDELPGSVAMDEASAERFVTASQSGRPVAYVATFGTLSLSPANDGTLDFNPERSAIYADAGLTSPIAELDPAALFRAKAAPSAAETAVANIQPTDELGFMRQIYARLAPRGLGDSMVESSVAVRNANEFEVAQARKDAAQALASPAGDDIWLTGSLQFGTYALDRGVFPEAAIQLNYPVGENSFEGSYNYSLADPRQVADIAVPEELARRLGERGDRRVDVMARVGLVDVGMEGDPGYPTYHVALDLLELVLTTRFNEDGDRPTLVARVTPGEKSGQVAAAPPITRLDSEALDYLRLKYAPDTMDDAAYERMLVARWSLEQSSTIPQAERFFPAGTDIAGAEVRQRWLDDFKQWATARAEAMPDALTLGDCVSQIGGAYWQSPIRGTVEPSLPGLAEAELLDRVAQKYAVPHTTGPLYFEVEGYLLEGSYCAPVPPEFQSTYRSDQSTRSGAVIALADAVVPGMVPGRPSGPITYDVTVDGVEVLPHPAGSSPVLIIRASLASAHGDTFETMDRDRLAALKAEETAVPDGPGWDIVGLKPGQPLEEADGIIRAHMDVALVFARKGGVRPGPYFTHEVSYVASSLSEAITLTYEPGPSGDVVYAISRVIGQQLETMPTDAVLASLRDKYGPEQFFAPRNTEFSIAWWSERNPKSRQAGGLMQHCYGPSATSLQYWDLKEGSIESIDPSVVEHLQIRGLTWLPGSMGDLGASQLELGQLDCGTVLNANKIRSGNNDQLFVQLFDYPRYARAIEDAVAVEEAEPEDEPEKPALEFKF